MKNKSYLYIPILILMMSSCKIYRFSSTSLPPETKTFYIENFYSKVPTLGANKVAKELQNKLRSRLLAQDLIFSEEADIKFSGVVTEYQIKTIGEVKEIKINIEIEYIDYNKKKIPIKINKFQQLESGTREPTDKVIRTLTKEILEEIWSSSVDKW